MIAHFHVVASRKLNDDGIYKVFIQSCKEVYKIITLTWKTWGGLRQPPKYVIRNFVEEVNGV